MEVFRGVANSMYLVVFYLAITNGYWLLICSLWTGIYMVPYKMWWFL